jgi:predicted metal-dependent phosphoesterase TrpH
MESDRVVFKYPRKEDIPEGCLCADMHFHTRYSDSYTTIPHAIALAKKRGVGVAVTDHNLIGGSLEALELAKQEGVFVVPGIEISAWDGPHILVYFYSADEMVEYWKKNTEPYIHKSRWLGIDKGTEWILDSLEDVNCVVSAAHPLGYLAAVKGVQKAINCGRLDKDIAKRFDSYEVICSGMFRNENIKAKKSADEYGLGYTGGSDGHLLHELGRVITINECDDLEGFLNGVKNHTNFVIGKEKNVLHKFQMALTNSSKFALVGLPWSLQRKYQLARYHGTPNYPKGK